MASKNTRSSALPLLKNRLRNVAEPSTKMLTKTQTKTQIKAPTTKTSMNLTRRRSGHSTRSAFGDITNKGTTMSLKKKIVSKYSSSKIIKKLVVEKIVECTEQVATSKIIDVDAPDAGDPLNGGPYCYRIFQYLKSREPKFVVSDYLVWQTELIPNMRAVLVDWMVEVQENFELNHETLYMAVKIVDLFLNLSRNTERISLQLIAATSLFLSAKYDERCPPALDDFLYICDDAYTRNELLQMEVDILNTLKFDIGMPLSYRFLRRYAKCGSYKLICLTLARFILESSLLDYQYIFESESKMAAACLLLSTRMLKVDDWNATLVHYTGRTEAELETLVARLNRMNVKPPHSSLTTILNKYRHKIFMSVANIPALPISRESPL